MFSKFIHYVNIKFGFRKALFKERFESNINFGYNVVVASVDVLKKLYSDSLV